MDCILTFDVLDCLLLPWVLLISGWLEVTFKAILFVGVADLWLRRSPFKATVAASVVDQWLAGSHF